MKAAGSMDRRHLLCGAAGGLVDGGWVRLAATAAAAGLAMPAARAGPKEDFFKAVALDRPGLMSAAIDAGFDPNTPDDRGQPAIVLAMREGSFEVAELLLSLPKLDVDKANGAGETALMVAALRGHVVWIGRLVARGAAVNRAGWTPLHYAASGPEAGAVTALLERGAAVEAPSANGTTPLMMAAGYGAIDAADLLLARGADSRRRNQAGLTAADFARRAGRDRLAERLESSVR